MNDAVGSERISTIVGYKIIKGDFGETTPNLPQRIAIFGEANTANQGTLNTDKKEITSAQQAGELYGFGSPIHVMMRILRPLQGSGIGGIPTIVLAQASSGAAEKIFTVTPSGTATKNGTHFVKIGGRDGLDGQFYAINIVTGDTVAEIKVKITDAINAVLGSTMTAVATVGESTLTSKWTGLTADSITVEVDTNDVDLGIDYVTVSTQSGSGTPSVQDALDQFGQEWVTIVVNSYGIESTVVDTLEAFNGIPDPVSPTGRYAGIVFKPFFAITGSVADNDTAFTDTKKPEVTIAIAPAPLSKGMPMEAAANMALLYGRQAQDNPELDVQNRFYVDMPTPDNIGSMEDYENRDLFVKKGNSTVELVAGRYKIKDFVTTYHPDGELPPQFRYVRNLNIDFNFRFGYLLLEAINVLDHVLADDFDFVSADKVIKPKQWKAILFTYIEDTTEKGITVQPEFTKEKLQVGINNTNPDRFDTEIRYKRSGFGRIASTTAETGFNFGNV